VPLRYELPQHEHPPRPPLNHRNENWTTVKDF